MALYLITYDITSASSQDYAAIDKILSNKGAIHVLGSVWLKEGESSESVADILNNEIGDDDGLLVIEVTNDATWSNLLCSSLEGPLLDANTALKL